MADSVVATLARAKIEKARRFLEAAELMTGLPLNDVVVSLAVTSAINAADTIQLLANGEISKGDNHRQAIAVLRKSGHSQAAKHLGRCLEAKSAAQYGAADCTDAVADGIQKQARRILSEAERLALQNGVRL